MSDDRLSTSPLSALSLLIAAARVDPTLAAAVRTVETGITNALANAWEYSGIDGAHHKQWVIAQMVKNLTGSDYDDWVENLCGDEFEWDEGSAP